MYEASNESSTSMTSFGIGVDINLKAIKIVIDCGNGVASNVAPKLLRRLGCEVIELFCEIDGSFPNHQQIQLEVRRYL